MAVPERKTIVRKPRTPKPEVDRADRPGTRDTTRARTEEVTSKAETIEGKKRRRMTQKEQVKLTQEQLLEEARVTEEWNRADYDAYMRYTELSEKEKAALVGRRRQKRNLGYSTVFRTYIENGEVQSEIRLVPPATDLDRKRQQPLDRSTRDLLGLEEEPPTRPPPAAGKYRYPYDPRQVFNTIAEFEEIHWQLRAKEKETIQAIIGEIDSFLPA